MECGEGGGDAGPVQGGGGGGDTTVPEVICGVW